MLLQSTRRHTTHTTTQTPPHRHHHTPTHTTVCITIDSDVRTYVFYGRWTDGVVVFVLYTEHNREEEGRRSETWLQLYAQPRMDE